MPIKDFLSNDLMPRLEKFQNRLLILGLAVFVLDIVLWSQIAVGAFGQADLKINFLDVGQGDSQLLFLPGPPAQAGGVKILIDGGPPNGKLLEDLAKILPPTARYIDLVVLSHPQLDHFGGLIEVLRRYRVGAFISNGHEGIVPAYEDLKNLVAEKKIPDIILAKGDKIRYQQSFFKVLLPDNRTIASADINDTALVLELTSNNAKALFTGDMSAKIEASLLKFFHGPVDILKVAHHGSRFSSSAEFLNSLHPKLAVIEVGKNSYGHPTNEVLDRLKEIGASIFRTDQSGNLELVVNGQGIKVFAEK